MRLAFIYFEPANTNFRKNIIRYNSLLKNYYENHGADISNKLNDTFNGIIKESLRYEFFSETESQVYNAIIDVFANEVNEKDIEDIKNQVINEEVQQKIASKITSELPNIDKEIIQSVAVKSQKMAAESGLKNLEVIFVPSIVKVEG